VRPKAREVRPETLALVFAALLAGGCSHPHPPESRVVAAVGDSITAGVETNGPGTWDPDVAHTYPCVAAALLRAGCANAAVNGRRTDEMPAQVASIPVDAAYVIVNAGTNDVLQAGPANPDVSRFDRLIAAIRARAPSARLVFVTLRRFRPIYEPFQPAWLPHVRLWNAHERSVARDAGAAVLDLENDARWYDRNEWPDNVHASIAGAERLGRALAALLTGPR
jgi:lysophospholipase L1-like esterase